MRIPGGDNDISQKVAIIMYKWLISERCSHLEQTSLEEGSEERKKMVDVIWNVRVDTFMNMYETSWEFWVF